MIRTLAEIHADGTVLRVTAEDVARPTGERLYTAREVGDLQASEAELVAAPLRRKLAEVERELARRTEERDEREAARAGQERRVAELERLLAQAVTREDALEIKVRGLLAEVAAEGGRIEWLEERVRLYDEDRRTERDRADSNRAWAERAENRLSYMAQEKREAVTALAEKLGQVAGAVHSPEIVDALARLEPSESDYVFRLAHAVRSVRTIVGSPSLPATPDGPTSQA